MRVLFLILCALRDLVVRWLPRMRKRGGFAFLVHPRDTQDVYRKYPFLKILPNWALEWLLCHFWPVVLSEVEGLKDKNGDVVKGCIITIPLTARQMLGNRKLAKKKILCAIKLSEKLGAKMTGLGALTSSVTNGGLDVAKYAKTFITSGNSLTAGVIVLATEQITRDYFNNDFDKINLAIVGATGSIGKIVARFLSLHHVFNNLILVGRTAEHINELEGIIKNGGYLGDITTSLKIEDIISADVVIVATNAEGAIVHPEHLKQNSIIYDITHPKNTSGEIKKQRKDVKIIDGGMVSTPGINYHFNFGVPLETAFACLAETMVLSAEKIEKNYSLGDISLDQVEEIISLARKYNFQPII